MADGWRVAITGASTFLMVALLVPLFRRVALRRGITDAPAPGKAHASPTPYLGGVAVALGAVTSAVFLPEWGREATAVFMAALAVGLVGLIDDLRDVGPVPRVVVEAAAAGVAAAAGARVQLFGGPVDYVVTIVWIVVITNSFNLLDNMDAAVGSIVFTIATALAVTALANDQILVGGIAVGVAAACMAFLLYNWHPARIFLGDAGSLFLGFLLAVIALKLRTGVPHAASAVAVVLLVGPAVFDTLLVVISRLQGGRRLFIGGTDHTSHRLILMGFRPTTVTAMLVAGTLFSCTLGVLVAQDLASPWVALPIAVVPAVGALGYLLTIGEYDQSHRGRSVLLLAPAVARAERRARLLDEAESEVDGS